MATKLRTIWRYYTVAVALVAIGIVVAIAAWELSIPSMVCPACLKPISGPANPCPHCGYSPEAAAKARRERSDAANRAKVQRDQSAAEAP